MCLRPQITNRRLKQNVETQDVDGMQPLSVLYVTQLEISQQHHISLEGAPCPRPLTFPLRLRPRKMQHYKSKIVGHLPLLAPCKVFFSSFTIYLYSTNNMNKQT